MGQHPAFAFYTSVPFGMTAEELNIWYYHMGGRELQDELTSIFNLKTFLAGNTGTQAGGWFHKQINGPEDFDGLRFRMPGLGGKALGHLGASVQNIPGAEVYNALAKDEIDGTEWIGPWADEEGGVLRDHQDLLHLRLSRAGTGPVARGQPRGLQRHVPIGTEDRRVRRRRGECLEPLAVSGQQRRGVAAPDCRGRPDLRRSPTASGTLSAARPRRFSRRTWETRLFSKIFEAYRDSLIKSAGWISLSSNAYTEQRNRVMGI